MAARIQSLNFENFRVCVFTILDKGSQYIFLMSKGSVLMKTNLNFENVLCIEFKLWIDFEYGLRSNFGVFTIDSESMFHGTRLSAEKHPCLVQYFLNPRS
jgi:hypothetical protein